MAAGAEVQGAVQLDSALASAADQLTHLDDAAEKAGALLVQRGEQAAPRDTGYLASQHAVVVTAGQLEVVNAAPYAVFVHARDPWLARELDRNTERIETIYADQVEAIVGDIEGK